MNEMLIERTRVTVAVSFLAVALGLTAAALAASHTKQCTGYCGSLPAITCDSPKLQCCCDLTPAGATRTWACVCQLPTDCNKANSCQDP